MSRATLPRTERTLSLVLLACLTLSPLTAQDLGRVDAGVARVYYRAAGELIERGERREAERLLDVALEFSPFASDALYLKATLDSDRQETAISALEAVGAAIGANRWRDYAERDGRVLLADLLIRTREYRAALDVLSPMVEDPPSELVLLRIARAYAGLGDESAARAAAERGRRLYPEEYGFQSILLGLDDAPGFWWGRWLRQNASSDPSVLSGMLYYAERQPVADETRAMLDLYFRHGGVDPLAAVVDMVAGGDSSVETFRRLGGFEDLLLVRRLYEISSLVGARSEIDSFVRGFSGWIEADSDRDGFYEARALFDGGVLRRWEQDGDQNGVSERTIYFDGLVPLTLVERDEATLESIRVEYQSYPDVSSVTFRNGEVARRYVLIPGRIEHPIVDSSIDRGTTVPDMLVEIVIQERLLNLNAVERFAVAVELRVGDVLSRIESYDDGVLYLTREDRDGDGQMDHIVEYQGGMPTGGVRDLDGDGHYEVSEQYADGELALILVDNDLDGIPEFQTRIGTPTVMAWDFDGDGIIDARELLGGRESLLNAEDEQ